MRSELFLREVRGLAGLPTAEAARQGVAAVLATLAEELPDAWADHLAADLPAEIGWPLRVGRCRARPAGRDRGAFIAQIAGRVALPPAAAERLAEAVLAVTARASDPDLLRRIVATLPEHLARLLRAPAAPVPPAPPLPPGPPVPPGQ
jgi:uncharacterized protein (DUF2267 family)